MEMMDQAAEGKREELRRKLRENFDGRIVRKDLTKKIKEGANVPVYVLEFLISFQCFGRCCRKVSALFGQRLLLISIIQVFVFFTVHLFHGSFMFLPCHVGAVFIHCVTPVNCSIISRKIISFIPVVVCISFSTDIAGIIHTATEAATAT